MKIVRRGKNPAEVPFKLTCKICDTVVELVKAELLCMRGDRSGEADSHYCDCPVCKGKIWDSPENRKNSKDYLD